MQNIVILRIREMKIFSFKKERFQDGVSWT